MVMQEVSDQELIENLKSDIEDFKYYYNELLDDYASVCDSEGLGNYQKIKEVWSKLIAHIK